MQNSSMSLPNRSRSVTEIPTLNGEEHRRRSEIAHSNSTAENSNYYKKSSSYIKPIKENSNNHFQSIVNNNEELFRTDKYNNVNTSKNLFFYSYETFILIQNENPSRIYPSASNGHLVYRTESVSHVEHDDIYRLQRLYRIDDEDRYKTHYDNEHFLNTQSTVKLLQAPLVKTQTHELK